MQCLFHHLPWMDVHACEQPKQKQNDYGLQSNMAAFLAGCVKRATVHECGLY